MRSTGLSPIYTLVAFKVVRDAYVRAITIIVTCVALLLIKSAYAPLTGLVVIFFVRAGFEANRLHISFFFFFLAGISIVGYSFVEILGMGRLLASELQIGSLVGLLCGSVVKHQALLVLPC
jgi:hypothetical protein